jgi:hypothetical protein
MDHEVQSSTRWTGNNFCVKGRLRPEKNKRIDLWIFRKGHFIYNVYILST